jgi:hypothetical protein
MINTAMKSIHIFNSVYRSSRPSFLGDSSMAQPNYPAQALVSHLINQTLNSIAQLESLAILNSGDAQYIRSKLPPPAGPFPSLNIVPATLPTSTSHSDSGHSFGVQSGPYSPQQQTIHRIPPLPPRGQSSRTESRGKVLWDYNALVRLPPPQRILMLTG